MPSGVKINAKEEANGCTPLIVAVVSLIVALFAGCNEARLGIWGETVEATITKVNIVQKRRSTQLAIGFRAKSEDGKRVKSGFFKGPSWAPPGESEAKPGQKIRVVFLASDPKVCRLADEGNYAWILLLLISFGAGYKFYRDTNG